MVAVTGSAKVGSVTFAPTSSITLPASTGFTHGRQITNQNVGLPGKGLTNADLTVVSGSVNASSFGSTTITRRWFKGRVTLDKAVTFTECRFDFPLTIGNYRAVVLDSNIDVVTPADWCIGFGAYEIRRCILTGCSDVVRTNGYNTIVTDCWGRVAQQGADDHHDGAQNEHGVGNVEVSRCNFDIRGPNGNIPLQNAALFSADSSTGNTKWYDNYLAGGAYTISANENCVFDIQGNEILDGSWANGPVNTNKINPASVWGTVRPNVVVSAAGLRVATV